MSAKQRRRQQEISLFRFPVTCSCGMKYDFWNGGACPRCVVKFCKAWGIQADINRSTSVRHDPR